MVVRTFPEKTPLKFPAYLSQARIAGQGN